MVRRKLKSEFGSVSCTFSVVCIACIYLNIWKFAANIGTFLESSKFRGKKVAAFVSSYLIGMVFKSEDIGDGLVGYFALHDV